MVAASKRASKRPANEVVATDPPPIFDLIELMFFAYRDFVGDADRLLESYGFGRAHHRVLHFVHRRPGMTIAELLEILKITKQSLNRVMKDLLEAGFIEVRSGASDRRQRRLFVSGAGRHLALELANVQSARFRRALGDMGGDGHMQITAFLLGMIDPHARPAVLTMLGAPRGEAGASAP